MLYINDKELHTWLSIACALRYMKKNGGIYMKQQEHILKVITRQRLILLMSIIAFSAAVVSVRAHADSSSNVESRTETVVKAENTVQTPQKSIVPSQSSHATSQGDTQEGVSMKINTREKDTKRIESNNSSSSLSVNISSRSDGTATQVSPPANEAVAVEINGESATLDLRGRIDERFEDEHTESRVRIDVDNDDATNSGIELDISVEGETKEVRR